MRICLSIIWMYEILISLFGIEYGQDDIILSKF